MKIDPRSDRIALHYTGNDAGEPAISGVPARDLTENDVHRLLNVEHGELRGAARAAAIGKLVDQLTTGPYRRSAPTPVKPAARAKAPKKAAPATSSPTPPAPSVPRETPAPPATPAEPSADSAEGEQP